MDSPKFSAFNITSAAYKVVNGHEISVHVLVPKAVHPGPRPLLIHFHGGFLVTGDAIFPDWSPQWSFDYTLLHSAVYISPNYRLLPEATGIEILSDLKDFWTWIQNDLPAHLERTGSGVTPDFDKVLAYGGSAGGYLAIQTALTIPDFVKAVIAAYPMTYADSPWYSVASTTKSPMGAPQIPRAVLDNHIASIKPGRVVAGAFPPDRTQLSLGSVQHGLLTSWLGAEESLYPAKVLGKRTGKEKVPFLFAFHGREDSAVPCEETERFVREWEEKFGKGGVVGKFESGDHGFDGYSTLETQWLKEGLEDVTKAWIG